ncbi:MAG: ribonuclease R [Amoebophilaceae bacterium]|nr:ribonuclease R [Amoebophilaceae bacterium]
MPKPKTKQKVKKNRTLLDYRPRILTILQQDPKITYTRQQLYAALQLKKKTEQARVKESLLQLLKEGIIHKTSKDRYLYPSPPTYLIGHIDYVRAEYAYMVVPGQAKDVLVWQKNLAGALHNDLVKVQLLPTRGFKRLEGVVVEILERNKAPMIGLVIAAGNQPKVIIEQKHLSFEVLIEGQAIANLAVNDKVIIALTSFPGEQQQLKGKIVQHLGPAGIHEVEIHAIMAEFDLKDTFPDQVIESMQSIAQTITNEEIARRKDLRHIPTFTIDPADAQDFDDALSYQRLDNGGHQVGIHIADVSHYILPATLLDDEAYARNTSVYLVDRCIPMLPELLSNDLCSLRPDKDKLTFSAVFELDESGKVQNRWFGETVIHSNKRFSYEEAQAIIDAKNGDFYQELTQVNSLAKQLRTARIKQGAINFETRELLFELDEEGKPLQLIPKVRKDTHKLIEEFMLLANKEVASYVAHMKQTKEDPTPTFIYRTHDDPDPEKLNDFFAFVKQLGYKINVGEGPIFKAMHHLEQAIQGTQEESMIQSLAIRAMAKALYTTEPKPHFALAFRHYSHFTSPIRRYPDLLVHRLLKQYLQGIKTYNSASYEKKCQHAVERERVAMQAERASIKYKQVEFIKNLGDQLFEGTISGITEWNIYVEIIANGCEGMIRLSDLTDDQYSLEENKFQLTGKHTKKSYRIGDLIKVKVKSCDLNKRLINFILV